MIMPGTLKSRGGVHEEVSFQGEGNEGQILLAEVHAVKNIVRNIKQMVLAKSNFDTMDLNRLQDGFFTLLPSDKINSMHHR